MDILLFKYSVSDRVRNRLWLRNSVIWSDAYGYRFQYTYDHAIEYGISDYNRNWNGNAESLGNADSDTF